MKYDMDILRDNIKRIMKEKGCSQENLAQIIGTKQSSVSNLLSGKDGRCFTVNQLMMLAEEWDVSIDELFGIDHKKKIEGKETLADVVEAFFLIDKYCGIKICEEPDDIKVRIKYKRINDFIAEWGKIRNATSIMDKEMGGKMYALWKKDILEKFSHYPVRFYSSLAVTMGKLHAPRLVESYMRMSRKSDAELIKERYAGDTMIGIKEYFDSVTPETIDLLFVSDGEGKPIPKEQQYELLEHTILAVEDDFMFEDFES